MKLFYIFTALFFFIANSSFGQGFSAFGNDVIAHDDFFVNDEISDISVAFNGWIYLVTASLHTSPPSGADLVVTVSKDSGISWTYVSTVSGAHNNIFDIDIIVTGNDTNSLRIYIGALGSDTGFPYETGYVYTLDARTGTILPFTVNLTNPFYPITGISLASDYLHPAAASTGYSVAILYSMGLGNPSTDSLVCLIAPDTGSTHYNYYLVDTGLILDISISYGFSQSNDGKYYIAYTGDIGLGYCKNISGITSGFTQPINIISQSGTNITNIQKPKIICQNSLTNNDSTGLSGAIIAIKSFGNNKNLEVFYNMQTAISDYWKAVSVDDSAGLGTSTQFDVCFSEASNQFFISAYNNIDGRLFSRIENFNFTHPDHWLNVSDQYNDSVIDAGLIPHPKVSALGNNLISSWCSRIPSTPIHNARTLFDKNNLSFITNVPNHIKKSFFSISPIPADDYLSVNFSADFLDKTISVELVDMTGKVLLKESTISVGKLRMNTSALKNGIYLLKIFDLNNLEIKKVMVFHSD